jgi:phosphopantothenoylcysteine decarboxylase/phosphopantothenate--cysteine ligase
MRRYDLGPPRSQDLGDRAVDLHGTQLAGRRIALMVCGGIAAMKAPALARAIRRRGAEVVAFLSKQARRYVAPDALAWATTKPVVEELGPQAEHLSDMAPFDAYLVAPATYNTINKAALGIADGPLTATLASALGRMERGTASVLVAPTMHGTMHNSILTESLRRLQGMGVRIVPPRDVLGKDAIPEESVLVAELCRALSDSPLRQRRVLVAGGTVAADAGGGWSLRPPATRATLGACMAEALTLRGAEVLLLGAEDGLEGPDWLSRRPVGDAESFRVLLHATLATGRWEALVMAATLPRAELQPRGRQPVAGDVLTATAAPDLLDQVLERNPSLPLVWVGGSELRSRGPQDAVRVIIPDGSRLDAQGAAEVASGATQPALVRGEAAVVEAALDALERSLG